MLRFKLYQNRTVNEEFDFWGCQILSGGPEGGQRDPISEIQKAWYRTQGLYQAAFSILAQIESVYKSGELIRLLVGVLSPPRGSGWPNFKIRKSLIQNGGANLQPKFQHPSSIRKCLKNSGNWNVRRRRRKKDILDPILAIYRVP